MPQVKTYKGMTHYHAYFEGGPNDGVTERRPAGQKWKSNKRGAGGHYWGYPHMTLSTHSHMVGSVRHWSKYRLTNKIGHRTWLYVYEGERDDGREGPG